MAKFSRFLAGGMIGAGVALLLSPKTGREIRRMLIGAGRKALPPSEECPAPVSYESATPAAVEKDFESQAGFPVSEPQSESLAAASAGAVSEMQFPAEEAEETEAEMMIPGEEKEGEPVIAEAAEPDFLSGGETLAETAITEEKPAPIEETEAHKANDWESLKTPVWGEPTIGPENITEAVVPEAGPPQAIEPPVEVEPQIPSPAPEANEPMAVEPAVGEAPAIEPEAPAQQWQPLEPEPEQPTVETAQPAPSGIDPDEMRRRIDETRNRLKAKALGATDNEEKSD